VSGRQLPVDEGAQRWFEIQNAACSGTQTKETQRETAPPVVILNTSESTINNPDNKPRIVG
jgi:hypothetical protein